VVPHLSCLKSIGVQPSTVRSTAELDDVEALVIPGGESTSISKLLASSGLFSAIAARLADKSLAVLGTCAGMILSARTIVDGTGDQKSFEIFDAVVRRNGVGRQQMSFERKLDVRGIDTPVTGIFIRPPVVESVSGQVEVLAEIDAKPVVCAQGRHLFATFHPELADDDRIHRLFRERL